MFILRRGMAYRGEDDGDIRLALMVIDQHISILTTKLKYLNARGETYSTSWILADTKHDLDQAMEERRRLKRLQASIQDNPKAWVLN